MRAPAVSFAHKLTAAILAALLTFTLVPLAHADGEASVDEEAGTSPRRVVASSQGLEAPLALPDLGSTPASSSTEAADPSVTLSGAAEGGEVEGPNSKPLTLASGLVGAPSSFINSDVALDGEPVIGSFAVGGFTFAVIDESRVELVGIASSVILGEASEGGVVEGSDSDQASEAGLANLVLPETVSYEGSEYALASIAPYAFYLSGVTDVTLPTTVSDVDDRAFRSSDVASVTVAEGSPTYSSFDGALYDADQLSLLLIPEGKQGTVRIPKTAEVAEASVFSHCPLVDSISVDAGSAAFASENGLLYTSDLTTLLRVPAGAIEITIREGCTTIAAGALEACANLITINAPATVTSISPDVFHAIPTVSLPAASVILGEDSEATEVEESNEDQVSETGGQLTAMVALSTIQDDALDIDLGKVIVFVQPNAKESVWVERGFTTKQQAANCDEEEPVASLGAGATYRRASSAFNVNARVGGYLMVEKNNYGSTGKMSSCGIWTYNTACSYVFDNGNFSMQSSQGGAGPYYANGYAVAEKGYTFIGWNRDNGEEASFTTSSFTDYLTMAGTPGVSAPEYQYFYTYAVFRPNTYTVTFDLQGGYGGTETAQVTFGKDMPSVDKPLKKGCKFLGFYVQPDGKGAQYYRGTEAGIESSHVWDITNDATLYAHWEIVDCDLSFDIDTEPDDEDYPGNEKPDQTVTAGQIGAGDKVEIEDPKRPGYVFQGWTIPNVEGTEAVDQNLVYKGEDGKWYVDASQLPDYAGEDGRVELTARWTSVISVDVPSSVTFYADVVTQGDESREGLASSAFGQNKVQSQSEVDLRIVGLESKQVKGNGSTSLGASDILKKKDGSTVSGTADKLLSLYPATGELTEDDLKDPNAISASKPVGAVDFSLDDILLEKSFAADSFTIPAGDTLSLGYRLNLQETATELDYDKLSTLDEGASASIANISYCFAADNHPPTSTGSTSDDFYIEHDGRIYGPEDIKMSAGCISRFGKLSPCYELYESFLNSGMDPNDASDAHGYVKWGDGITYNVRIIGINHDDKSDGSGKAGLTFQFVDLLNTPYYMNYPTCGTLDHFGFKEGVFNSTNKGFEYGSHDTTWTGRWEHSTNLGGWGKVLLRHRMNPGVQPEGLNSGSVGRDADDLWKQVPQSLGQAIVAIDKKYYNGRLPDRPTLCTASDKLFLPSYSEIVAKDYAPNIASMSNEGPVYAYYNSKATTGNASNGALVKRQSLKGGTSSTSAWTWLLRSCDWERDTAFLAVGDAGNPYSPRTATQIYGIAPCFAL